ncbi:MAG: hypothetical protein H6741_32380 [Alphaproteobacteria bacterium]|nr:hypothetical protein [Alphaproteobacteria bacterium]
MHLLLMLLACGRSGPSELRIDEAEVKGLYYGFSANKDLPELSPEDAFKARGACPRITRALYTPGEDSFGTVQLWGEGLDRAQALAALRGGLLGEAPPHAEDDGSVRFALNCRSCELILGMRVEGVPVGCRGPGHSLYLERGKLVAVPEALTDPEPEG